MKTPVFTGVCTALVTPFSGNKINYQMLDRLLEHQISCGIQAVCVCGTTGEASTLSEKEQLDIICHTAAYCKGRIKVIAGTGSNNTEHAVSMSRMANALGVDALLVVTPYYNKASAQGLISHYSAIADAVNCPIILYNVPSRTGMDIPLEVYKSLSKNDAIIGVKDASGDLGKTARILDFCGDDFHVWSGNDDQIVPMMSLGAKGVISVLSNLCPQQTLTMVNACFSGDYVTAGKMQCRYMDLIDALFCEVNPIPIKHAMNALGFHVGAPRLPLCSISKAAEERLTAAMIAHNIIDV